MGPLETFQSGLNGWMRDVQVHLAGKGIVTAAVVTATVLGSLTGMTLAPMVIALGGVGLNMFHRFRDQWHYQDDMAVKYRNEIATQLGIDPETVTREHVKLAAYGNEQEGIDGNPILAQALDRQRSKSWLVFGTALLAAGVTFTLLTMSGGAIAAGVGGMLSGAVGAQLPAWMGFVSNAIGMMGGAVIAAASSLFIQDGLEFAIGHKSGISAPSAHDRITAIEARHARGKTITPEQILQVKIASDPELDARVKAMTGGKAFNSLKANMQGRVLAQLDLRGELRTIAIEINKGHIDATELAFILTGQQPIHKAEVAKEEKDESVHEQPKKSFTERLGLHARDEASHVDRIDESRVVPIEAGRA